jgi:ubiquinone/menaquinone biosynthesis C-methylase UbiE
VNSKGSYWEVFWANRPREVSSDHELDRLCSRRDEKVERVAGERLIDFIDPKISDIVFDAGCGTGINISKLHAHVAEIVGMDFSKGMAERARERIKKNNIGNAEIIVGNIAETRLSSNIFTKTICLSVLQYLDDEECISALRELVRVSRNNAILILHVKNLASLYLSTLVLAKKIKNLLTETSESVNYRTYKWYENNLSKLGAGIIDYDSTNIFMMELMPAAILRRIRLAEMKYCKWKYLHRFGADYFIKARVLKT